MPQFKNIFGFLKWFITEIIKTFSNEPSFFSSKRIERMMIFINAMTFLDVMMLALIKADKIDPTSAVTLFAAQMAYAGWTTKQIFNEKPKTNLEVKQDGVIAKETETVDNK